MAIVTDYHMHTPLCLHARGPLEGYVEHAIHLGLREIGFADHNPLPDGRGANVRMKESELDYYVNRVIELQYQYRGKIDIRLGLELDYVKGLEDYLAAQVARYPWDYIIGSIHYLDPECRQGSWPHGYQGTVADLYGPYFSLMRKLAQTGFCDIIAHFDVPKRSGCFLGEAETGLVTDMLQAIARAGLCMEINTSGYRHPELPAPQPYPSLPIVKQALALGIPLAVNSDAHDPDTVGLRFGEVETWLRQHGCQKLMRFDRRQRTEYVF